MRRHRWLYVLFAGLILAGLARLRFDADVLHLLPGSLPAVRGLELQQQHFANARELLITIRGDEAETVQTVAAAIANHLSQQTNQVASARWQPPWLENPNDAAENLGWLWLQQSPENFSKLAASLEQSNLVSQLAAVRESLATSLNPQEIGRNSYDPLGMTRLPGTSAMAEMFDGGAGIFSNTEGTYRVIFVAPADAKMNYRQATAWLAAIRVKVEEALSEKDPAKRPFHISYTGGPAFLSEISTGMEGDLKSSVASTIAVIGLLFWLAHRSWRPLGWLVLALALTLVITLALGGLIFGTLNAVSLGFAAVLLGLAVDYGLVSYQEFIANPEKSVKTIRHEVSPGIWYSATTTAATFSLLSFAGLPGLSQLGVLTALGLLVGAAVMLYVYLPVVARASASLPSRKFALRLGWLQTSVWPTLAVAAFIAAGLLWRGIPKINGSADPLRPRSSAAYDAMDELKTQMGRTNEPLWALCVGTNQTEVAALLSTLESRLADEQTAGRVLSYNLPAAFWPRPEFEQENLRLAKTLALQAERIRGAAATAGFTTNAFLLADGVFRVWNKRAASDLGHWPDNRTAQWLSSQFAAHTPDGHWLALGIIQPGTEFDLQRCERGMPNGIVITSWNSLAGALLTHVGHRVILISVLIGIMLLGCLWLAFRNWRELGLGLAALGLSFALLLVVMAFLGWSWNLLSLVALPLLLGSSVDSTIHVQLALRRHGAHFSELWRTTGKALFLCAGANIAGFSSLAFTNNAGLASLDLVCAIGVGCVFSVCLGLLPAWWYKLVGRPAASSSLYTGPVWRLGLWLARTVPEPVLFRGARIGVWLYRKAKPARFAVVVENLLPVCAGDRAAAEKAARDNFANFSRKLVDLWRWESGISIAKNVRLGDGREHFLTAVASRRGVLLVTLHLGNWEFGASLLEREGVRPLVLTAQEPAPQLTELRSASRARQGIETLVVGADPFAFVEVIKRLNLGGTVAILLDRPAAATAADIQFFGRRFSASLAAAELARASGCVVLPVVIAYEKDGYLGHVLAPIDYDRGEIRTRESRTAFTGRILNAFEPLVRQYKAQWYHFVPVWPAAGNETDGSEPS